MFYDICFSGGGLRIISFIGVIKFLIQNNYIHLKLIKNLYGVSAGSILALKIILGFSIEDIESFVYNIDYKLFIPNTNSEQLIFNYGMDDQHKIHTLLKTLFISKNIPYNITFKQLFDITNINLTIGVTNITKKIPEYWNHINKPHLPVITAIKASCCIPIVFKPLQINHEFFIDGAIFDNFPIHITNDNTLGIMINNKHKTGFNDFIDYIFEILQLYITSRETHIYNNYKNNKNIIVINSIIDILDFNITKQLINKEIYNGFNTANLFIKKYYNKIKRRNSF